MAAFNTNCSQDILFGQTNRSLVPLPASVLVPLDPNPFYFLLSIISHILYFGVGLYTIQVHMVTCFSEGLGSGL